MNKDYKQAERYEEYSKYREELLQDKSIYSYFEIRDENNRLIEDDIQFEEELIISLEEVQERLEDKYNQDEYDDDSTYFRSNYESIYDRNGCKAYKEIVENYTVNEVFYNEETSEVIEKIQLDIKWFI